ncbi:FtsW/RodA/SpoVE family cell cycle protein [Bacillus sp. IB182487]|uniref:FtsW/RodA/SpoVE family cell cycle protein n=1 Tax=Metabacillus arenae TaxID=2771434 RepID=A0A926RWS2_9BACI|nr:FtsW/RodA/SpoVE family cell cycle protein [Metabacillus arenae]
MTLIYFHVFQNIWMVSGLIPITGIPLPCLEQLSKDKNVYVFWR